MRSVAHRWVRPQRHQTSFYAGARQSLQPCQLANLPDMLWGDGQSTLQPTPPPPLSSRLYCLITVSQVSLSLGGGDPLATGNSSYSEVPFLKSYIL